MFQVNLGAGFVFIKEMRRLFVNVKLIATTVAVSIAACFSVSVAQAQTVKIAFVDPLSGPFAPVGQNQLRAWQTSTDFANEKNWAGGPKFEMVPFDNKGSPQESLTVLKQIIDQGIRYVAQGNGSGVAIALSDAIQKHNDRNPGKEIVFMNYAAVDPSLTNERCSFWHFRLDVNGDMKMEALSSYIEKNKDVKKVYLINQDYAFGRSVAIAAKKDLARKRPDVQIVGEDLHPLGQVKDFSPYVAKIKAAGADTIVTGNWGADLALMIKAAKDAGVDARFYTYYAGTTGVPTAMGSAGEGKVSIVANWHPNLPGHPGGHLVDSMKKKFKDDFYTAQTYVGTQLLAEAMKRTKSIDPTKVAFAMEGMKLASINGDVEMRASDHQIQQNVYIATWSKVDTKGVKYDAEDTKFGWRNDVSLPAYVAAQPTSCQMKRPAKQ
jgi:branched-chain amino acid transport system substrate-binding protein